MTDSNGAPAADGGDSRALSKPALIGLSVLVGLIILGIVLLLFWLLCCRRKSAGRDDEPDNRRPSRVFKTISIIGRNQQQMELSDRKLSLFSDDDRKNSLFSDTAAAAATEDPKKESERLLSNHQQQATFPAQNGVSVTIIQQPAGLPEPNSKLVRSTYLEFPEIPDGSSRRSSRTSQEFTMDEVDSRTKQTLNQTTNTSLRAPLAVAESYSSVRHSALSSVDADPNFTGHLLPVPTTLPRKAGAGGAAIADSGTDQKSQRRPYSEVTDNARNFVPKLPPKKSKDRFAQLHKSAANITDNPNNSALLRQQTSVLSTRSENCVFTEAEDLDYDDLPPTDHVPAPIIPPKLKPLLPPKQKINKSQKDLAKIEKDLKASMTELRFKNNNDDMDYDDLPAEPEAHEYEDYDDPVHRATKSNHEFEDYDEPIQHNHIA